MHVCYTDFTIILPWVKGLHCALEHPLPVIKCTASHGLLLYLTRFYFSNNIYVYKNAWMLLLENKARNKVILYSADRG